MMIHPPMLYSGYTLFAVPFAFAVGALVVRRVDAEWIGATRRFALAAWFFLGVGILLGARWSYSELGWGGYWAWDPVENASLLPWLTGTAFIHSLMIQEKRGMLKVWNVSLVLATGTLAILGTFLVRSGILDSIHAFGASTLGVPFVTLIALMIAGSMALVVSRRDTLRSEQSIDSLLTREAIFLFNNLVLVAMAFVVFCGTFFPLITEALGNKVSVGPPVYDRYIVPLALMLVLLSGIGPVVAWRRTTLQDRAAQLHLADRAPRSRRSSCSSPLGVTQSPPSVLMFAFAAFVIAVTVQEFVRGAAARRAMAGESPRARDASRSCAATAGATAATSSTSGWRCCSSASPRRRPSSTRTTSCSSPARRRRSATTRPLRAPDVEHRHRAPASLEKISFGAVLDVSQERQARHDAAPVEGLLPVAGRRATSAPIGRFFEGEATSEVGMKAGLRRDLWTAMSPDISKMRPIIDKGDKVFARDRRQGARRTMQAQLLGQAITGLVQRYRTQPPPATFRMISSPLVAWIWIGGLVVFAGGLIALWPAGDPASAASAAATPPGSRASSAARSVRRPETGLVDVLAPLIVIAVLTLVVLLVSAPLRGGASARAEERDELAPRRPRGRARGEVPRDPRRRARLPHRQALRGRLARARPRAARRGDRDPAGARRAAAVADAACRRPTSARRHYDRRHGADLLRHPGRHLGRPDLPRAHALGEGRRPLGRLRRRHRVRARSAAARSSSAT